MNELARETLVAAALQGHTQIKLSLHDLKSDGECALGILHLSMHKTRQEALDCCIDKPGFPYLCSEKIYEKFGLTFRDVAEIQAANDSDGWDFLAIARKCCLPKDEECPS